MKVNDKGVFIDGIDKKILRALMQDARMEGNKFVLIARCPFARIARKAYKLK